MLSEKENSERLLAMTNALASARMEGLEPDALAIADAVKWVEGEMTIGDAISAYKTRLAAEISKRIKPET